MEAKGGRETGILQCGSVESTTLVQRWYTMNQQHETVQTLTERWPEFEPVAQRVADIACLTINRETQDISSDMPYKAQAVLERVIQILNERV